MTTAVAAGKVSKRSHLFARAKGDWYVEPPRATQQLLSVERFVGDILDPACGQGNIVMACREAGLRAFGTDITVRVPEGTSWFCGTHDFLGEELPRLAFDNIITNPPFGKAKLAEAFIRRALPLVSKLAVFVDVRFVLSERRAKGLYRDHPPSRIWHITPRVSCPPGEYLADGGKAEGDTKDYCWLVWDQTAPPLPMALTGWLVGQEVVS